MIPEGWGKVNSAAYLRWFKKMGTDTSGARHERRRVCTLFLSLIVRHCGCPARKDDRQWTLATKASLCGDGRFPADVLDALDRRSIMITPQAERYGRHKEQENRQGPPN